MISLCCTVSIPDWPVTYGQLQLNDECVDYLTKALEVSKSTKNDKTIACDYVNLSTVFSSDEKLLPSNCNSK